MLKARPELGGLIYVIPGIRPEWAVADGQTRFTTPGQAVSQGADYLVIGSPITKPSQEIGSPVEAVKKISEEIQVAEQNLGIKSDS